MELTGVIEDLMHANHSTQMLSYKIQQLCNKQIHLIRVLGQIMPTHKPVGENLGCDKTKCLYLFIESFHVDQQSQVSRMKLFKGGRL